MFGNIPSPEALLQKTGIQYRSRGEGGFAPNLKDAKEALSFIMEAVQAAGYEPGEDIRIALDVAASELYDSKLKKYVFAGGEPYAWI